MNEVRWEQPAATPPRPDGIPQPLYPAGFPGRAATPVGRGASQQSAGLTEVASLLPADPRVRDVMLGEAITWLIANLDSPQLITAGCSGLGETLGALSIPPARVESLVLLLAGALRPDTAAGWRREQYAAWNETSKLVARWMSHGATTAAHQPPYWTATVVGHQLRRQDLAVLRIRTFLPYPYLAGDHALVESDRLRESWRPCWIANPPGSDNLLELHVRCGPDDEVGRALVGRTAVGDRLRLRRAPGSLSVEGDHGTSDLLLIADDTGIAPMRSVLADVRRRGGRAAAHLLWLVPPNEEPYDLAAVSDLEDDLTTVMVTHSIGELSALIDAVGPTTGREVLLAGTPTGVTAVLTVLAYAGVPTRGIRYAVLEAW